MGLQYNIIVRAISNFSGLTIIQGKGATLFLPSTTSCFSDTGATTPSVVDGVVARINSITNTGIFASQATTANQPILRRGTKNIITWSNDLTNVAWTKSSGTTVSGSTITTTQVLHSVYNQFTVVPLMTYTFQFKAKRGTQTELKYSVYDLTNASDIVSATSYYSQTNSSTSSLITVTFMAPFGCSTARVYVVRDSGVTGTVIINDCQVEYGEIANTYALTTTAPASSNTGSYWLDFDGINDSLAISAIPWTNTQDQFVSLSASFQNSACTLFSNRGSTTGAGTNGGVSTDIGFSFPNVECRWRDTTASTITIPQRYTYGKTSTFSAKQIGSVKTSNYNNISRFNYTQSTGAAALSGSLIGAVYNATPFNFFAGGLYAITFGAATVSDSELTAIDAYIAQQSTVDLTYTFPSFIGPIYNTDTANFIQIRPRRVLSYAGAIGSQNRQSREIGNMIYDPAADPLKAYKMWWTSGPAGYTGSNTAVWAAYSPTVDGPWTTVGSAVIANATLPIEDAFVILDAGVYHLFGENKTGATNNLGICHFTSSDGFTWTRVDSDASPAFDKSASGWDNKDVSSPILWKESGTYYMIYEGRDVATNFGKIGLATATTLAGPWTRVGTTPIYSGNPGAWDDHDIVPDDLKKVGSTYYMCYHGSTSASVWGCGYITSTDLINWSRPSPYQYFGSNFNFEMMWHLDNDKILAIDGDLTGTPGKPGNINVWTLV
jgi:hypothetical protein